LLVEYGSIEGVIKSGTHKLTIVSEQWIHYMHHKVKHN